MKCGSSIIWRAGHSKHTCFTFRNLMHQFGLLHLIFLSLRPAWSSIITPKGLSIPHSVFFAYLAMCQMNILLLKDERSKVWKGWHWTHTIIGLWQFFLFLESNPLCSVALLLFFLPAVAMNTTSAASDMVVTCGEKVGEWPHTHSPTGRYCHLNHSPAAFAILIVWCSFRQASCHGLPGLFLFLWTFSLFLSVTYFLLFHFPTLHL